MADEVVDAGTGGESQETGSSTHTPEQIIEAMFTNPLGASAEQSDDEAQDTQEPQQETAPSAKAETLSFGKVTVDGQEMDFDSLPKEKALELLRKGATFDQRLSKLDQERAEVERLRKEYFNPETQEAIHEARVLQRLRESNPAAYEALREATVKAQTKPAAPTPITGIETHMANLDKLAETHKDYPLVGQLTSTVKELYKELATLKGMGQDVAATKQTLAAITQRHQVDEATQAKNKVLAEVGESRRMLLERGVDDEVIKAKSKDLAELYLATGGKMSFKRLTETVFAAELANATTPVRQPDKMKSASAAGSGAGRKGGEADVESIQMALFGRKLKS